MTHTKKNKEKDGAPRKALYRTYRPSTFAEVTGQDRVVSVLQAAIKKGTVAHAYLFSGTRGTGKTSIARILARELGVADVDVYEIDAASHTSVDDVREIREGVPLMPFESPYKVYIIDEAHMLSKAAWNALLKTLEEPPAHVIFVFATTEIHKVPDTIVSRCETYTLMQPSRELLTQTVTTIAQKEGYTLEQSAAELIAVLAEGSFRDAISILQKVLTISHDTRVDVAEVERVTGAPTGEVVRALIRALNIGDVPAALAAVRAAAQGNIDARVYIKLILERMRTVILIRNAPAVAEGMRAEYTAVDFEELTHMAQGVSRINSALLKAFLVAYDQMSYATLPYLPIELAIIDSLPPVHAKE